MSAGPITVIVGCGYVGSALATLLLKDGHTVYGLRRNVSALPDGVRGISANLGDPGAIDLPNGIDYLVYCAAADSHDPKAYRAAYVNGLANTLAVLKEQDAAPRRILFTSSTSVYHQDDGSWVDETTETAPDSFSGKTLLEGERLLFESGLPAVAVRLSGIYGPGRRRTIESVRDRKAVPSIGPAQYMNHIHRDDCAGALRHLLSASDPDKLFIATDSDPADRNIILAWLAERLGVPPVEANGAEPVKTKRFAGNKRCKNAKLLASGYTFRYPTFREGYGALIDRPT